MRKTLLSLLLVLASMVGATHAYAQVRAQTAPSDSLDSAMDSALDKTLANLPLEKMLGQMLTSIDVPALSASLEQAAKDVAAGKSPQPGNSPAVQEIQATMQKRMATLAPELVKSMLALIGPVMHEIKSELARDIQDSAAIANP
jgi:hypothetical protein